MIHEISPVVLPGAQGSWRSSASVKHPACSPLSRLSPGHCESPLPEPQVPGDGSLQTYTLLCSVSSCPLVLAVVLPGSSLWDIWGLNWGRGITVLFKVGDSSSFSLLWREENFLAQSVPLVSSFLLLIGVTEPDAIPSSWVSFCYPPKSSTSDAKALRSPGN